MAVYADNLKVVEVMPASELVVFPHAWFDVVHVDVVDLVEVSAFVAQVPRRSLAGCVACVGPSMVVAVLVRTHSAAPAFLSACEFLAAHAASCFVGEGAVHLRTTGVAL